MLTRPLLITIALAAMTVSAWAASPEGTWTVAGTNPDGQSSYAGIVTVTRTGETYQVVWRIGDDTYRGTGVLVDGRFGVAYDAGGQASIALYAERSAGEWSGRWALGSDTKSGTETWKR
jgi:hypothetical protein